MGEALDRSVGFLVTRIMKVYTTRKAWLQKYISFIGAVLHLPMLLFLILGPSLGLHWWRLPWPQTLTTTLVWIMSSIAVLSAFFYILFGSLFFLYWGRGKLRVSADKRPSMAYTFVSNPLQYVLIAIWGSARIISRSLPLVLDTGLALFCITQITKPWLQLLRRYDAKKS